ncbi:MAG: tRNA preQ1(34) S-adenosylmethionine ribosyltransferase-isomerase QueA [Gemmatimonadales bacterium]
MAGDIGGGTRHRAADFEYRLPPELIAQQPLANRSASRMLVVRRSAAPADSTFSALPDLIPPGDLLVLNTTRVRHARLLGKRPSGAPAEVLLIHPAEDGAGAWLAIGQPGTALRAGKRIHLGEEIWVETLQVLDQGYRLVRIVGASASEAIARFGRLPLPPYITRDPGPADESGYQTVYAEREGSVAAPTAGLHFTSDLLDRLERGGVKLARLDLEVGPGTFKPVEVEDLSRHPMHPERYQVPPETADLIRRTKAAGAGVWAVGTTVVRALESAAAAGGGVQAGAGETRLMIVPGYRFQVVDHLLTNFHLPRSTLLMLVSAFAGYDLTMAAYRHAVTERYRFYSYGDAMVVV